MKRRHWAHTTVITLVLALPCLAAGQTEAPPEKKVDIKTAWDELLKDVIPNAPADPVLLVPQTPFERRRAGDFLNHFFFQSSTEYVRQEVSFTGRPTTSGVFNGTPGAFADPRGIPAREPFQPNSDQFSHFMNWGTRGWLSQRVNTNFSFRYRQDLSHVEDGSPTQTILNTFGRDRRIELLSGFIEIKGLSTDSNFSGASLQLGRQYTYGADLAAYDGASFTWNRPRLTLGVFGGRRFTYYSDPDQRAIGGGNVTFRITDTASLEYSTLFYVKGSHNIAFRNRFAPSWLFNTQFKMVGGSPVDYRADVLYLPAQGRSSIRVGFFQKLSSKDYFYDYTLIARDLDAHNRLNRLNLGPISPYTQIALEARRDLVPRVRVGGSAWIRRLNDANDQGPFDASFNDYRINSQIFAPARIETFFEIHQRDMDRRSPLGAVRFDDVSIAGETRVQDARFEIRRTFGEEGRLTLKAGAFYRRFNFQDRFFFIDNAGIKGWIGGGQVKLDQHARLYFDYSLDDDFFIFRPSIKRAQVFVVGTHWKF